MLQNVIFWTVNFIFTKLDVESLIEKIRSSEIISKSWDFIKSNKIMLRATSFLLSAVIAVVVTIVSVGITVGFNVKYSGKVIATVQDSSVFENAKDIATEHINSAGADVAISAPKYTLTLTVADKLDTATKVANAIIENTDKLVYGTAIKINGEVVACTDSSNLSEKIEAKRTSYYIEGAENSAHFTDKVEFESGYYLKNELTSPIELAILINNLSVKTVSRITTETNIPFESTTVETNKKTVGYEEITTVGEDGILQTIEEVENVDGFETYRINLSDAVIKEPVNEVKTVGTAKTEERAFAASLGFICPMASGTYRVSSYWGDGRNHQAMDFSADVGVSIHAASSGTVTYSGFDHDYGYNLIIDHGNGIKTRYAHANELLVNNGDTVSQGDVIAYVGNTGRSTGSHLHFEVILKGVRVDPLPYITK